MQAHYAGAVPQDLLASEMKRLTRQLAEAETEIANAQATTADIEERLHDALNVAAHCERAYGPAVPTIRRQINQGFFEKLFIGEDGNVARVQLTEPFAALLASGRVVSATDVDPAVRTDADAPTTSDRTADRTRAASAFPGIWADVAAITVRTQQTTVRENHLADRGVNETYLVEVPGIEPGSSAASSRLLRAQLTMPLLGPTDHMSKFGVTGPAAVSFPISVRGRHWR